MRIPRLGPRDLRAIRLGGAVLVPALAWSLAVSPYLTALADARDQLAGERGLLRRELQLLASASSYPAAFDDGAERLMAAAPRLMSGDDEGAAAAALAGYLRRMANVGGANLTRVEPVAAEDAGGGIRALPVAVTGETDLEGLLTFLQALESGPKLVHVRELRMEASGTAAPATSATPVYSAYTAAAAQQQPEVITFRFTATAFTLAAQADSSAAVDDSPLAVEVDDERSGADELREQEGDAP
jgi:hypothetical protein